eukprot:m.13720 g.13720  ORF g.13720 m.13720 type:complete len:200 (+) comp25164_c0_seq1:56-655(+)
MEGSERLDTGLLKDVLSRLRRTVPISHYIRYIKYIHFHLSRLMDSGGKQRYRRIDKSRHFQWHDDFKTVAFQTDEAPRLLIHLGFQEQTNFLVLNEFESNQSFIISLCELATEELTIVKCDPASRLPLLDTSKTSVKSFQSGFLYFSNCDLYVINWFFLSSLSVSSDCLYCVSLLSSSGAPYSPYNSSSPHSIFNRHSA